MPAFRTLDDIDVTDKRVLVRADLNVPVKDGPVTDTTRIDRTAMTLRELTERGARVVVLSHFGRPKGKAVPEMSLRPVVAPLSAALGGRPVAFAEDCVGPAAQHVVAGLKRGDVALLENLRFHAEEEADDAGFAKQLAALGDLVTREITWTGSYRFADEITFRELLGQVRETALEAYAHQDLPFERLIQELKPERDLSRNPLFQVMLNMADLSERVLTLSGCKTIKLSHSEPSAKFDLTFYAPEIDGRIELGLVYNAELFAEPRMTALLEEWEYLLAQAVENPQAQIEDYSLVTASARALLPDPTEPLDDTWEGAIHTLFSTVAQREPHRLAVQDRNESWTYGELDARSNQLAHHLVSSGIQPKDVIAIYAHRSSPLVFGLLGVLKAGAAFLILDPAYPSARLVDYVRIARPKGWIQVNAAGEPPRDISDFLDSAEICCRITLPRTKEEIGNWLRNVDFRRALSLAVDRDKINEILFLGIGTPGSAVVAESSPFSPGPEYRTLWSPSKPDLEQANALLDSIGLTEKDSEGYRLRTDGKGRLRLEIQTFVGFFQFTQVGEMIREQWKKIGIDLQVQEVERSLAIKRAAANEQQLGAWNNDGSEHLFTFPLHVFPFEVAAVASSGPHYTRWFHSAGAQGKAPEPRMRELMEKWKRAFGVPEKERIQLGKDIWKIAAEEVYIIGVVGIGPAAMGVRVVKNNMGNIPSRQYNSPDGKTPGISRPATFYWKN